MTPQTHNCIHEDKWGHTEAQVERLETKHEYNQDLIKQMIEDNRRFEEKLDKLLETTHQTNTQIDHRITTIETKLKLQEKITAENYTKTTIIIGIVGILLTILTISLNHIPI